MTATCPYCGKPAELISGNVIYPHRTDLTEKKFWRCAAPCDAYVGCHPGTTTPLGRLANASLRKAKMAAHAAFDPLWKTKHKSVRAQARCEAYVWMAEVMKLPPSEAHIGMFDEAQCARLTAACMARAMVEVQTEGLGISIEQVGIKG